MSLGLSIPGRPGAPGTPGVNASATSAIVGQADRFYAEVACVFTFDATSIWTPRNDEESRTHNVDLVTTDTQKIRVSHATIGAIRAVGSPHADPGENLSAIGIRAITRPTKDYTDIVLKQDRTIADALTNPGDGGAWVREKGGLSELTVSGLENLVSDFAAYTQGLANVAGAWRMSEASGTTLDDAIGANDGTVVGSGTTYGVTGGLPSDATDKALKTTGISANELTFPLAGITQAAFSLFVRLKCPPAATVPIGDHTSSGNRYYIGNTSGFLSYRMGDQFYTTTTPWASFADNNWHTIGMTKNGAVVALYLDGVQVHTASNAGSVAIATPWHFGRAGAATVYSEITLSELVTYSRALTAQEAENVHTTAVADGLLHVSHPNLGNTHASGITLTSIGDFEPVLVAGSVTQTGFSVKFRDASGDDVATADAGLAVGIERKVVNRAIDPTAISVDVRVVKEDTWVNVVESKAPIWWVRLGEPSGSSFNDEIGTNDGTGAGTLTLGTAGYVVDDADTAVTFDGAQGKIAFANPGLTGAWSFGCIAKITGAGSVGSTGYGTLLGAGATKRLLYDHAGGVLFAQAGGATLTTPVASAPKNIPHVIFFTWDGTTEKWYVDGLLVASAVTASVSLNAAFWLGSYLGTSTAYSYKGDIDEAMLFDSALGINDIQELTVTAFDTLITADRSTQAQLRFEGTYETEAPAPDEPPEQPAPTATPLPDGDVGGAVSANRSLAPYRAQLNSAGLSAPWIGRLLPATQPARDAIALNGLPGLPAATSDHWRTWFCHYYGIDPVTGAAVATNPETGGALQGGTTPLWMDVQHYWIYVVDDDQPLRPFTDVDATVGGWHDTFNAAAIAMGGVPMPADALTDYTGDRYVLIYRPPDEIWTFYAVAAKIPERAATSLELTGSPSSGGVFLEFDYVDTLNRTPQTFVLQTPVVYNETAASLLAKVQAAKTASGAVLGTSRQNTPVAVVSGGPLNVAPLRIEWSLAMALRPVAMRISSGINFLNSGTVHFTYENAEPWSSGRLCAISSPAIANPSHHVVAVSGSGGGTATATGMEQLPLTIDWNEYKAAYDIGIADGWDAPGTDLGGVIGLQIGNCGTGAVYPALRGDGSMANADGSKLKEGALVTFPLDATTSRLAPEIMPLFNTIQRYGAVVFDRTTGGTQFVFRSWGWPGLTMPTPAPSAFKFGAANYPVYMRQLPWEDLQIIDPAAVLAGW